MRVLLIALAATLLVAPAAFGSGTQAVDDANAVKAEFHARNVPASTTQGGVGPGVPNRTLKVVVTAVNAEGTVDFESAKRDRAGTLDLRYFPELIAQDAKQFRCAGSS